MSQQWNANQYIDHAAFVAEHGLPVLALLHPQPGEHILDLGCGDGALTLELAKIGVSVLGVDASPSMIDAVRKRGLKGQVMNGEQLTFSTEFDAVFSNAVLHWMKAADAVLSGVFNALKPNGRFVGEFGGAGNIGALVQAMHIVFDNHPDYGEFHNPWYFPGPAEYRRKLEAHGFEVTMIELIPRPTPLSSGIVEWLNIFTDGITQQLNPTQKAVFLREVEAQVKPVLFVDGQWCADYVRLRFNAVKRA
jgi:2-isopropylmalate synthase